MERPDAVRAACRRCAPRARRRPRLDAAVEALDRDSTGTRGRSRARAASGSRRAGCAIRSRRPTIRRSCARAGLLEELRHPDAPADRPSGFLGAALPIIVRRSRRPPAGRGPRCEHRRVLRELADCDDARDRRIEGCGRHRARMTNAVCSTACACSTRASGGRCRTRRSCSPTSAPTCCKLEPPGGDPMRTFPDICSATSRRTRRASSSTCATEAGKARALELAAERRRVLRGLATGCRRPARCRVRGGAGGQPVDHLLLDLRLRADRVRSSDSRVTTSTTRRWRARSRRAPAMRSHRRFRASRSPTSPRQPSPRSRSARRGRNGCRRVRASASTSP